MLLDLALSWVLAAVFGFSGAGKLAGLKSVAAQFQRWGYAPSVRIAGGVLEVGGAALLLLPELTLYGVLVLLGVLGTALYTHFLRERKPSHAVGALVLLGPVIVLGLLRGTAAASVGGAVFRALFG